MDQGRQVRPELDPAFLPQVRGQSGEAMAVRPGLQSGQLHEKAGVPAGRGAGKQGNADRDTGTDQPTSARTWLACFESTGI